MVTFESISSIYGDEVSMLNDMTVVVEDLHNVEFNLIQIQTEKIFYPPGLD